MRIQTWLPGVVLAVLLAAAPVASRAAAPQQTFATPEQALSALVAALRAHDTSATVAVLGPGSEKLVNSGDKYADAAARQRFLSAYAQKHALQSDGSDRMLVDIGDNDWPFPIPIVHSGRSWHFDSIAGAQELIDRRIGTNEVQAIRTLLGTVDAQKAYYAITGKTGHAEYAQRLLSQPGKRDGLYWPATSAADESPLGPIVETAEAEGYPGENISGKPIPYQGYYFRILKAQGPFAPGGAKSYLENGRMTGGFAAIAWPASYGSSGIMTFIVDQDGIVFQRDLGSDTASAVKDITTFNPGFTWTRLDLVNR